MHFFGFEIRKATYEEDKKLESIVAPQTKDGATIIYDSDFFGHAGYASAFLDANSLDMEETARIDLYREIALVSECDRAIDDIINEAITYDDVEPIVSISLDDVDQFSEGIKNKIRDEFYNLYNMLNFQNDAYEIFRDFYVDGVLPYHMVIDKDSPNDGIKEVRKIDPKHIKKIKEISTSKNAANSALLKSVSKEYYIYSEEMGDKNSQIKVDGIKIGKDSIVYVTSGLVNKKGQTISYLEKAIKPLNQLVGLEDSTIIYRITRAPERRVFNVEVGDLPRAKAESYITNLITRLKNKITYDPVTGKTKNSPKTMNMSEDYYFPTRDGKGTTVDTLTGGQNLGEIEDVQYFLKKLYRSLNVPVSRLDTENTFTLGRATEITRDEVKFSKFIKRLRLRFSDLFKQMLRTQLVLKKIITSTEWDEVVNSIMFNFQDDSHFAELKESEVRRGRIEDVSSMEEHVGTYYSREFIQKNVLMMTEDEIEDIMKQIDDEKSKGIIDMDEIDADTEDGNINDFDDNNEPEPEPEKEPEPTPEPKDEEEEEDEKPKKESFTGELSDAADLIINSFIEGK